MKTERRRTRSDLDRPARRASEAAALVHKASPIVLTVRRTPTPAPPSPRVADVTLRFGLDPNPETFTLADRLSLDLKPGTITLLTGPSGTGKSALLEAISRARPAARRVDRIVFPADLAVVDAVLPGGDLRAAAGILTACALSEPRLWLRLFAELSAGEQFRAMLARAIGLQCRTDPTDLTAPLLCDEFGAVLHRRAARAVAFNLRKLVTARQLCLVVATSGDDLTCDLQPDVVVRTTGLEIARATPAVVRRGKRLTLGRRLRIERGRKSDYDLFAPMHYRKRDELGFVDRVYLLRDGIGGEPLAIVVYAHGPMELSLRNLATSRRFLRNPARLNRELRIIRRIVVHPDIRGCGLGHFLIRETMPMLGVTYVECLAGLGEVNPVFERAGMKRIGRCPLPSNRARIAEQLRRMRIDPMAPDFVTKVCRRPKLRRIVTEAVADWYRASTGAGEGRAARQSPRFLAETFRQMLGSRPVYYLWCKNEKKHGQLTVAPDEPDQDASRQGRSAVPAARRAASRKRSRAS